MKKSEKTKDLYTIKSNIIKNIQNNSIENGKNPKTAFWTASDNYSKDSCRIRGAGEGDGIGFQKTQGRFFIES